MKSGNGLLTSVLFAALAIACGAKEVPSDGSGTDAGTSAGGSGATDFFCGIESCVPGTKCCPATGRCYDPAGTSSCSTIICGSTNGQPPDPSCCPEGLALCAATSNCYHPGCEGCCQAPITCNQQSECPTGYSCCYATRQCYHPALSDCSSAPPPCASDGSCPGELVCCTQHQLCYEPGCTDCCPAECAPDTAHCGASVPCCSGLQCCSYPVPQGQEYCGTDCPISDRNVKHDVMRADTDAVLERVARMPISVWSYDSESSDIRHIGPMSQDFKAAFAIGGGEQCISNVDANGVALAAVQALYNRVERVTRETEQLRRENMSLRRELERLHH